MQAHAHWCAHKQLTFGGHIRELIGLRKHETDHASDTLHIKVTFLYAFFVRVKDDI